MTIYRPTAYAILLFLLCACILIACECFRQDYKVGTCDFYTLQPDGTYVFTQQLWIRENCGCDDLEARYLQIASGLFENECIICSHPYGACLPYNSCY